MQQQRVSHSTRIPPLSHPPLSLYTQAAKAEGELAESARKHADELGTRDEQIAQASRLANTELKEQERTYEAKLDEATAACHALERRVARADEASAASLASLASVKEEAALKESQRTSSRAG